MAGLPVTTTGPTLLRTEPSSIQDQLRELSDNQQLGIERWPEGAFWYHRQSEEKPTLSVA